MELLTCFIMLVCIISILLLTFTTKKNFIETKNNISKYALEAINNTDIKIKQLIDNNDSQFKGYQDIISKFYDTNKEINSKLLELINQQTKYAESIKELFNNTHNLLEKIKEEQDKSNIYLSNTLNSNLIKINNELEQTRNIQNDFNNNLVKALKYIAQGISDCTSNTDIKHLELMNNFTIIGNTLNKNNCETLQNQKDKAEYIVQILASKILMSEKEMFSSLEDILKRNIELYNVLNEATNKIHSSVESNTVDINNKVKILDVALKDNNEMMNKIYNDYDMLVELLKAGLISDLIQDIKKFA